MSAGATLTGALAPVAPPQMRDVDEPGRTVPGDERRSQDPVNVLARSMGRVPTTAVDPLEIAAALEAQGLNDRVAAQRYGRPSVFALAMEIFTLSPLRPHRPDRPRERDQLGRARLLRGALFALPALLFFPLARLATSSSAAILLVVVTVLGWAASQGLAGMAHAVHNREGRAGMLWFLRRTLWCGIPLVVGGAAAAHLGGLDGTLSAAAAIQAMYLVASIVMFSLDDDRRLAAILAPATVVVLAMAIADVTLNDILGVLMVAVAGLVTAAWRATAGGAAPRSLRRIDMRSSAVLAVYGAVFGLLILAPLADQLTRGSGVSPWYALAALPLTLSMGVAERRFVGFRLGVRGALHEMDEAPQYARFARRRFIIAVRGYTVALVALTVVCVGVGALVSPPAPGVLALVVGYTLLGPGIFTALLVTSGGDAGRLILPVIAALVFFVALGGLAVTFVIAAAALTAAIVWIASGHVTSIAAAR